MTLAGLAGPLEAILTEAPAASRILTAAIFCHPHPQYGGTMHNKVVYRMARAALAEGAAVLRFNFRGVGASAGTFDGGRGEQDDLRAAIRDMRDRYPGAQLVVGGFSFGARVTLQVCCSEPNVDWIVAAGTAVDHGEWSFLSHCGCPKHFVHSTQDEFGSRASMQEAFDQAMGPKSLTWVDAQDHFFGGALDEFEVVMKAAVSGPPIT